MVHSLKTFFRFLTSIRLYLKANLDFLVFYWFVFRIYILSGVWRIARSHTEPNKKNMVVVDRFALSFWRNDHEERVQCETARYRDAKTTSCLPKISFETVLSDPLEMPIVSARSLIVSRRFD